MVQQAAIEPLEGIRVVDCTQAVFGAGATLLLADMGADVIKIEPTWGDFMRLNRWETGGDSGPWLAMNRNKRSVSLDLREQRCKDIFACLLKSADILVHNFRVGRMESLGFGFEQVQEINKQLIYMHLSAYGDRGPMRRWAGGDMWAQAFGGVESIQGAPGTDPCLINVALADQGGAVIGALAMVAALMSRERNGVAPRAGSSLLDAILNVQSAQAADYLIDGRKITKGGRGWRGMFPFGAYTAADGDVVIFHGSDDAEWALLCKLLRLEHLLDDPRWRTPAQRMETRHELYPQLDRAFSRRKRDEWEAIFHSNGLRCSSCLDYDELFVHPQIRENNHISEIQHQERGTLRLIARPFHLDGRRETARYAPPSLGEHTAEVLSELGVSTEEIGQLSASGHIFIGSQ